MLIFHVFFCSKERKSAVEVPVNGVEDVAADEDMISRREPGPRSPMEEACAAMQPCSRSAEIHTRTHQ